MTESWEFGEARERPPEPGFPWPPSEEGPILAAFGATWKGATFDAGRFFADLPRKDGIGAALVYYLALGILLAGATLFWDSMSFFTGSMSETPWAADLGYGALSPLVRFLLAPAVLLVGLFISAGIVHVLLLMFGGADGGFGTTVRVFCYAYSPVIFGVVPFVGALVGGIWSLVVSIIGLREAHRAAAWKPVVAVLLPLVGVALLFTLLMMAAFIAAGSLVPTG